MSKYTLELRELIQTFGRDEIESWFKDYNLAEYLTADQIRTIEEYGVWSKDVLASRIVDHYLTREIGAETPGLFKHYAHMAMQEIMEEKLPLIYTASLDYDLLKNENYTETFTRSADSNNNTKSKADGSGLGVSSDTPQGQIDKQEILKGKYASATSATESTSTGQSESKTQDQEKYVRHIQGNRGIDSTYQALIHQYRDNILAINRDIIKQVDDLFIGLF